jgi:hypothetical protein
MISELTVILMLLILHIFSLTYLFVLYSFLLSCVLTGSRHTRSIAAATINRVKIENPIFIGGDMPHLIHKIVNAMERSGLRTMKTDFLFEGVK